MALNLDLVGKTWDPVIFSYDQEKVILYALGIGAGQEDLDYIYEENLKVYPTFAATPFPAMMPPIGEKLRLNLPTVLHLSHKIIMHKPIPVSGKFHCQDQCTSIYDKGDKGAVINTVIRIRDDDGDLICENAGSLMDRSAGNFGGDRGQPGERYDPPEGKEPDFRVEHATAANQAALYRLSGDNNPIHIDPSFARRGGLKKPILHGLCAFGFAGRAVLHSLCGNDPARLKSFYVQFMNMVYPGDKLITEGWRLPEGKCIIRTTNQDGKVVLGNAVAEVQ